jgi:hypothetical protein
MVDCKRWACGHMGYCHIVATFLPRVYALFAIRIKGLKVWEGIAIVLRVGFAVHTLALAIHIHIYIIIIFIDLYIHGNTLPTPTNSPANHSAHNDNNLSNNDNYLHYCKIIACSLILDVL